MDFSTSSKSSIQPINPTLRFPSPIPVRKIPLKIGNYSLFNVKGSTRFDWGKEGGSNGPALLGEELILVDLAAAALEGVAGALLPLVRDDHFPQLILACKRRTAHDLEDKTLMEDTHPNSRAEEIDEIEWKDWQVGRRGGEGFLHLVHTIAAAAAAADRVFFFLRCW